jgi:uncharacterized membrane protein
MTAVFSDVSYECPAQACSSVEQYIFSRVLGARQNRMVVDVFESIGVTEVLVQKKISNIYKQLQNVFLSVLLIKALSLIFHKLQVLRKPSIAQ